MATNKATKAKPAGDATQGIKVWARNPQGMRRAGRYWGPEGTVVALTELTEDELAALQQESGLILSEVTIPAAEEAKA